MWRGKSVVLAFFRHKELWSNAHQLSSQACSDVVASSLRKQSPLAGVFYRRWFASQASKEKSYLDLVRNIGISAHIDSGKTTLTERILYYTGKIHEIHEVRGKDGVGAVMDSMDLEREKGITIQSAATYTTWKDTSINIIDTPGHVDFTIEVERAMRVLDGAILVLCSVGGVQSQSYTVDRQMRRYNVPRLAFINKLDRSGSAPFKVLQQLREKLKLHTAVVQIPIGLDKEFQGVVDIIERRAIFYDGEKGEKVRFEPVPESLVAQMEERRRELIELLAEVDDIIAEKYVNEEPVTAEELKASIRRKTVSREFVPVFMGSAFKNKGVQTLLDGVVDYLPNPSEVVNVALDLDKDEEPVQLKASADAPFVGLAFKLDEGRFGQLTFMRVYDGTIRKGDMIMNTTTQKKVKVPRLVRMHASQMQDVNDARAGDIIALFGVECSSGDTFTDASVNYAMTSMNVPEPVMSLAVTPKGNDSMAQFSKALNRFQREDPTFRISRDPETSQTIISGMGELHLDIYMERMRREYKVDVDVGKPKVNFRETITRRAEFDYLHRKQSGGQGQYGRVVGYIEPLPEDSPIKFEFVNEIIGNAIPPTYIAACEKGFREAVNCGTLIGHPVERIRCVINDGAAHSVDSSELAFKLASLYAFRKAYEKAAPNVLEPIMEVEVRVPGEFQGTVVGNITRRKGTIISSENSADDLVINCHVPLNNMFGYSTELRSLTQGKGEFSMEYSHHSPVTRDTLAELTGAYAKSAKNES
eukprot:jgi/Mesvir1/26247/Mv05725-RA.1